MPGDVGQRKAANALGIRQLNKELDSIRDVGAGERREQRAPPAGWCPRRHRPTVPPRRAGGKGRAWCVARCHPARTSSRAEERGQL
jgi:hypothetical protein